MKRKVIQLAGSTLVVSLPSRWAKRFGIEKGNEVDVQEDERGLRIAIESKRKRKQTSVTIKSSDFFLRRIVDNPYRLGYDEVTFYFEDPLIHERIQDELSNLIGFEIIKHGKNYCEVKNLTEGINETFEVTLNRLMRLTISMCEDVFRTIIEKRFNELKSISKMENTNNKFTHFCKRMLNIEGYQDNTRLTQVYRTVCLLEEIGDDLRDLCNSIQPADAEEINPKILNQLLDHFNHFYRLYHKYSIEEIISFGKESNLIEKNATDSLIKGKNPFINHIVLSINNKLKHLSEDLS